MDSIKEDVYCEVTVLGSIIERPDIRRIQYALYYYMTVYDTVILSIERRASWK